MRTMLLTVVLSQPVTYPTVGLSLPRLTVAPGLAAPALRPPAPAFDWEAARPSLALPRLESSGSIVPSWFDVSGLSFVVVKRSGDGLLMAILRRGRFELGVYLEEDGSGQAIFTKYAVNPMGTPQKEEVALLAVASRRDVAELLRRTQTAEPLGGSERAAFDEIVEMLSNG